MWSLRRPAPVDLLIGALYLAALLTEFLVYEEWSESARGPQLVCLVALGSSWVFLRRSPEWTALVGAAAVATISLVGVPPEILLAGLWLLVVPFFLGMGLTGRALAIPYLLVAGATVLHDWKDPAINSGDIVIDQLWPLLALLSGVAIGRRQRHADRVEGLAADIAELAVTDERARIARELHDVIAHGVSVMVVQADAARHALPDTDVETRAVLATIERTGRESLREMRRLLGLLREEGAAVELGPQPGLADLGDLAQSFARVGLAVDVRTHGTVVPLSPGIDLAGYRVVQEALTNVLRHGGTSRASVDVEYGAREVELRVANAGGPATREFNGAGKGLIGMQERVRFFGGSVDIVSGSDAFTVSARLPLESTP